MEGHPQPEGPPPGGRTSVENSLVVAISGSAKSEAMVRSAKQLADALCIPWEALHVETPEAHRGTERGAGAAEALGLAARLGATIVSLPAATVIDGIQAHLAGSPAAHLVLGAGTPRHRARLWKRSLVDVLASTHDKLVLHVHADGQESPDGRQTHAFAPSAPVRSYVYAVGLVAATLLLSELLQLFLGTRPLDLLFLFPVVAVAARLGLRPALLAVALSVICYNFFLLSPAYSFNPAAPQNLVMTGVLIAIAIYTSMLTTRMRGRLVLSDRSARENASIAALAQKLTRDADWETTAKTICEHVNHLLDVQVAVFREVEGSLALAAATPAGASLSPLDDTALDWVWANGLEAGAGTAVLSSADWQFQPLKTSLGTLAVLALAREDGRDPVRPDQRLLLHTLVAQAALAHERLRLEDLMRGSSPASAKEPDTKP